MTNTYPTAPPVHNKFLTLSKATISTAGSVFVVPGFKGKIKSIKTVISGAIGTADAALTFEIDGVAVTGSAITVTQSGSAAGDVDSSTPTALNLFTQNSVIEMITDGASTNSVVVTATLELEPA